MMNIFRLYTVSLCFAGSIRYVLTNIHGVLLCVCMCVRVCLGPVFVLQAYYWLHGVLGLAVFITCTLYIVQLWREQQWLSWHERGSMYCVVVFLSLMIFPPTPPPPLHNRRLGNLHWSLYSLCPVPSFPNLFDRTICAYLIITAPSPHPLPITCSPE
jgi:hypothetical protein